MASKPISIEGNLKKRGGLRHNWLTRRFTLGNGALQYFDKSTFKGSIPTMFICEVRKTFADTGGKSDRKMPFRFELYAKGPTEKNGRTYFLSAATEREQEEWIAAVKSWIGYVDDATRKAASGGTREAMNSPRDNADEEGGNDEDDNEEKGAAAAAAGAPTTAATAATAAPAAAAVVAAPAANPTPTADAGATTSAVETGASSSAALTGETNGDALNTALALSAASSGIPVGAKSSLSASGVREEFSPNPDGSLRIVCEGNDPAAVAAAAQEAVARYAATHAAIQLDEGFAETSRTVEKRETEDGYDEVTTVTASNGEGVIKTYCHTVSIRNKPT